jgi:hypothetical protein
MKASYASSISLPRNTEDTIPSDRYPRINDAAPCDTEPAPPPPREEHLTQPYESTPYAGLIGEKARRLVLDEQATESGRPMPEWCIDLDSSLRAMTTFELWMALARGELGGKTRVWRDGMEGWEPIEEVPELAYALTDAVSFTPPLVAPAQLRASHPRASHPERCTPLTFEAFADAQTGDPPHAETPSPTPRPFEPPPLPARSLPRAARAGFAPARRGLLSLALGCVVAGLSIGLALAHTAPREALVAAATPGAPGGSRLEPRLGALATQASRGALEAALRALPPAEPLPPIARHHHEPGQKRSRRSLQR